MSAPSTSGLLRSVETPRDSLVPLPSPYMCPPENDQLLFAPTPFSARLDFPGLKTAKKGESRLQEGR